MNDKVKVKVENSWVTLDEELNRNYQKMVTKNAVSKLMGIMFFKLFVTTSSL
jgi:hypothetical protein